MALVEISGLVKNFETGGELTKVLTDLRMTAEKGEMIMIMGPSGSGKTTLLNIMGAIDKPQEGKVNVAGKDVVSLGTKEASQFRRDSVGFIFQFYNLLPTLTARENVELGVENLLSDKAEVRARAEKYLRLVGLEDKMNNFPQELSAGQQQRVAIARALAKEPKVVLADEPTGNLDEDRGEDVMKLMKKLQHELGMTFFIVSHDTRLRKYMDRVLYLRRGKLEAAGE